MLRIRMVRRSAVQWICCLGIFFTSAHFCAAQLTPPGRTPSSKMEQIPPPRELIQALSSAIKAQKSSEIAQLSLSLGSLMEGLARTDYLIASDSDASPNNSPKPAAGPEATRKPTPNPKRPLISMRGRVERLVQSLSMPQREAFEALYGAKATAALDSAINSGDVVAIEDVAHRWRYTETGMEATVLLARRRLDERRFSEAAQLLIQLRESSVSRKLFEPELSSLLVSAFWLSNEQDQAMRLIDQIAKNEEWIVERTTGPWRSAFESKNAEARLTAILGAPTDDAAAEKSAWPMFLGGPRRLGLSPADRLPESSVWRQPLVAKKQLSDMIVSQQQTRVTLGAKSIPAIFPTIVGDRLIVRTPERVVSYQLDSGNTIWSYPFDFKDTSPPKQPAPNQRGGVIRIQGGVPVFGGINSAYVTEMSKVWDNDSYGRTAANQRYSFVIDGGFDVPNSSQQQMLILGGRAGRSGSRQPAKVFNRLTAIDLEREGAVAWVVGGETGEMNTDLKGVFFLGPPLPAHNRLYVLFEREDIVHLGVLDAKTGATEWTLQLAPIVAGAAVSLRRRMLGATPSMDKGVLICPTTVNGLIAIDVARRQFLWGWAPATQLPQVASRNAMMAQLRFRMAMNVTSRTTGWVDSPVFIRDDVILHGSDDNYLYCLDRKTGELKWKRPRQDSWFVGCVSADVALLIGKHRYIAINMADGKAAWSDQPFRAIPAGGIPTGRGFSNGKAYFLPTGEGLPGEPAELLRIELATGKTQRLPLQHRLGNLASNGRLIVSAGPDGIETLKVGDHDIATAAPKADPVAEVLSSKSVKELIELLDADVFGSREAAMKELDKRGASAVNELGVVARGDSPESARRAVVVLAAFGKRGVKHPNLQTILDEVNRSNIGTRGAVPSIITKRKRATATLLSLGANVKNNGETLILLNWRGKPADLKHLKDLPDLKQLMIIRQHRGNEMIPFVSSLEKLKVLAMQECSINDKGLAALTNLPQLEHLILTKSEITDVSIPKLSSFKSLKQVEISNSKVSEAGVTRLKAALPNAKVTSR